MNARRISLLVGLSLGVLVTAGSAFAFGAQGLHWRGGAESGGDEMAGPDSARVASLLTGLGSGDPLVCDMLADQIGNFWTDAGRYGIGRLSDSPANVIAAKDSLHGRVKSAGAINLLIGTLRSTNPCTRRVAAKLLGRSAATTAQLSVLLADPSVTIREAAAYAIGGEERHEARGPLERLARTHHGPDAAMAVWALGEFGDPASLPILVSALAEGDAHVKVAAAAAIGELHDLGHAPPALVEADRGAVARVYSRSEHARDVDQPDGDRGRAGATARDRGARADRVGQGRAGADEGVAGCERGSAARGRGSARRGCQGRLTTG